VVLLDKWDSPVHIGFITNTALCRALLKRYFWSEKQVDNAAFFYVCLLMIIVCTFLLFFKKNVAKYSSQSPPPVPLRKLWPKQIRIMIFFGGAAVVCAPVALVASKSMFAVLLFFYLGTWFFADGLARGSLYVYFYFKYWRGSD
jgi:hypothetical protein